MAESFLHLPAFIADHMILQQQVRTKFYGCAPAGTTVRMTLERFPATRPGRTKSTVDLEYGVIFQESERAEEDGFFEFKLPYLEASFDSYRLTFRCGDITKICSDVYVGEVWFASGESNMAMPTAYTDARDLIPIIVQSPGLAFFKQSESGLSSADGQYSPHAQGDLPASTWIAHDDQNGLMAVSAIALSFALNLSRQLNCPVAVFDTAANDVCIHSFLPREVVEKDVLIKNHVRELKLYRDIDHWNEMPKEQKKEDRIIRRSVTARDPAVNQIPFTPRNQPGAIFNHKIAPYTGLAVRGILWYQGESDSQYPDYYRRALRELTLVFRQIFQSPPSGLSMIYSQITSHFCSAQDFRRLALFNEALAVVRRKLEIPAGVVTNYDLPLNYNINARAWARALNPIAKTRIGERMALVSLGLAYHMDSPDSAPECSFAETVGNKLILSFDQSGPGLKLRGNEQTLKGFTICGPDGIHVEAEAKVLYGVRAMVWHPEIKQPQSCSYAFATYNQSANLFGENDIPLLPFRLDREAETVTPPLNWRHCDSLSAWAQPPTELGAQKLKNIGTPSELPLWQVFQGRGQFELDEENRKSGNAALTLKYRKADEYPLVFGPILNYASSYPPLDLHHWSEMYLHVHNADKREKRISMRLHDLNGRDYCSEVRVIAESLAWQEIQFPLKHVPVDLMRLDEISFMIQDHEDKGSLTVDAVSFHGLNTTY